MRCHASNGLIDPMAIGTLEVPVEWDASYVGKAQYGCP